MQAMEKRTPQEDERLKRKREALEQLLPAKRKKVDLRGYQIDCIDILDSRPHGSRDLVVMPTGCGKTATFTKLPRHGKILILSSGNEVVVNPLEYFPKDAPIGLEMGSFRLKRDFPDAEIVAASVNSLCDRLDDYDPGEFHTIIIDEAHHATAPIYKKVIDHFKPAHLIGFTATPFRADGIDLKNVFDEIVFSRDIKWAIKSGYLCDAHYEKIKVDIDLRNMKTKRSDDTNIADFTTADLAKAMAKSPPIVADIYKKYRIGQTLIFVAGVKIAHETAALIDSAVAITGEMSSRERAQILSQFRAGKIPCIVNCGVYTEGVDIPGTETIILARPTMSLVLLTQMIGRGLRIYKGKSFLNLIEIEGIMAEGMDICHPPALFGVNMAAIPKAQRDGCSGRMLTETEDWAKRAVENAGDWLLQSNSTLLWAENYGYDLHGVNWVSMPDGRLELNFPVRKRHPEDRTKFITEKELQMTIPAPDALDRVMFGDIRTPVQLALDLARETLDREYAEQAKLWDTDKIAGWAGDGVTEGQLRRIRFLSPCFDLSGILTKYQASLIISKLELTEGEQRDRTIQIYPFPQNHERIQGAVLGSLSEGKGKTAKEVFEFESVHGCPVDIRRTELERVFCAWLTAAVYNIYASTCRCDINLLIHEMNRISFRKQIPSVFLYQHPKYQYVCKLDGRMISRVELREMQMRLADEMIPAIIQARILKGTKDIGAIRRTKPDIANPPLDALKYQFVTTRAKLLSKRSGPKKLPKDAALIKQQNMEKWAKKQRAKTKEKP